MHKQIEISLLPEQCTNTDAIKQHAQQLLKVPTTTTIEIVRKSLDARRKPIRYNVLLNLFPNTEKVSNVYNFQFDSVHQKPHAVIIGAGPAGLFAALKLIEMGVKPIIIERGKNVRDRRRDLAAITKLLTVNPDSNYCFGEGGAGTYSDGKLYTRSTKRGDVQRILHLLTYHGADPNILYEAHPHIGTNKLPGIITNIRNTIEACGGEFQFNTKLIDILTNSKGVTGVRVQHTIHTDQTYTIPTQNILLATGHSARDIFYLLHQKQIKIESKPFALGVRIEHPQALIDQIQYKCDSRGDYLPAAAYSIVNQSLGRGVFSFCMCPGGIIAPAATAPGEVVVNGWSPSKRNNEFANSGLVVSIQQSDLGKYQQHQSLAALHFQSEVEQLAFATTKSLQAPAQRVGDFVSNIHSSKLPDCSYLPGIQSHNLNEILPPFVSDSLRDALTVFGKKMKGYVTNEAVMVATESRTSSPVRIPRDPTTLMHPELPGLYPCAEGAGYAGGIVSAAMDGERCANLIGMAVLNKPT